MSATYSVDGWSTGLPADKTGNAGTPVSVSGGGSAVGYGGSFSASATNVNGGSVTVSASEGISDLTLYNDNALHGVVGRSEASVMYTIRIDGPATSALIPVDVGITAHSGALAVPSNVGSYVFPIEAFTEAGVLLEYASGSYTLPALPSVEAASDYDYKYFTGGSDHLPSVNSQTNSFDGVVMIVANQDIKVDIFAEAQFQFEPGGASYTETASGSADADPTFAITDPAFAGYTIVGVPVGSVSAVPLPASAPMFCTALMTLGVIGYGLKRNKAAA